MNESQLVQFVRGMTHHDIAKPFWLGNQWHTITGYAMLVALGRDETEALTALCHAFPHLERNLTRYWQFRDSEASETGEQSATWLPACLALASPLDTIAASSYTLMDEKLKQPRGQKGLRGLSVGSVQNPFSRLPRQHGDLGLLIEPGDAAKLANELFRQRLQAEFKPPRAWAEIEDTIRFLGKDEGNGRELETLVHDFEGLTWGHVRPHFESFAERTYPPMNDTALSQHGRLAAALALVTYVNLARRTPEFLTQRVTYDGQTFHVNGQDLFGEFYERDARGYSPARRLTVDHLDCAVLRVGLTGLQDLFETAVRLDDLQGVQRLAARVREALKRTLLKETLGLGEEASLALADLLPLSESLFELVYLVPGSLAVRPDVDRGITAAYRQALEVVVGDQQLGLLSELIEDFRGAERPMPFAAQRETLIGQLLSLPIGFQWVPVQAQSTNGTVLGDVEYDEWQAGFGRGLLEAYVGALQEDLLLPPPQMEHIEAALVATEPLAVEQVCEACGTNPCFGPFCEDLPLGSQLRKVVHDFRGRSERLCLTCVARRVLSHAQVRVPALEEMIRWDPDDPQQLQLRIEAREGGLPLPPMLARSGALEQPGDYRDLGAAFVRRFPRAPARTDGPQVFPTIGYACDANSNVVLITLTHTHSLFAAYSYLPTEEYIQVLGKPGEANEDIQHFKQYYLQTYQDVLQHPDKDVADRKALAGAIIKVEPHLARVMERIRELGDFYQALRKELDKAKVRVLPLETRWPVCRLMVPADAFLDALRVLDETIMTQLFSARSTGDLTRKFLNHAVPDLLVGTMIAFKQKQALYLALAAERALLGRLQQAEPEEMGAGKRSEGTREWRGLRLGLCDLRGTLTEVGPWHAQVLFGDAHEVFSIASQVDRRSLESAAALRQRDYQSWLRAAEPRRAELGPYTTLAAALLHVRGGRLRWSVDTKAALGRDYIFDPVLFLKKMTRA